MANKRIPLTYKDEVVGFAYIDENINIVHSEVTEPGELYDMLLTGGPHPWKAAFVIVNEQIESVEYHSLPAQEKEN